MRVSLALMAGALYADPAQATVPARYEKQPQDWFQSAEARRVAENILSWQTDVGSWPKNQDTASKPFEEGGEKPRGTFDNGATTSELRFLARVIKAWSEPRVKAAFEKGFDHLLQAQYPKGGWPQFYPPGSGYHRHITFNDDSMARILELLRDAAESGDYAFLSAERRAKAKDAFERGIRCIVEAQVKVGGERTVWCAQHDEVTLQPRPGRAFELVSLSGAESAGILKLLMSLPDPAPEVREAIRAGVEWYERSKITGMRIDRSNGDQKLVPDPSAPPVWARFYEIETNRPIFCGRDGVKKYDISEIERERRGGYAWYGAWGKSVAEAYAKWRGR